MQSQRHYHLLDGRDQTQIIRPTRAAALIALRRRADAYRSQGWRVARYRLPYRHCLEVQSGPGQGEYVWIPDQPCFKATCWEYDFPLD